MPRFIECVVVLAGAIILLPVFVFVFLLILSTLGRPVFFVQTRVGRGMVQFRLVKFRTMFEATGADGQSLSAPFLPRRLPGSVPPGSRDVACVRV
jgi:lipopolysaccharide/colanic/teichoic acid biosynthesis glycosyltransferase